MHVQTAARYMLFFKSEAQAVWIGIIIYPACKFHGNARTENSMCYQALLKPYVRLKQVVSLLPLCNFASGFLSDSVSPGPHFFQETSVPFVCFVCSRKHVLRV